MSQPHPCPCLHVATDGLAGFSKPALPSKWLKVLVLQDCAQHYLSHFNRVSAETRYPTPGLIGVQGCEQSSVVEGLVEDGSSHPRAQEAKGKARSC